MTDIMIDIETLGTGTDAVVISIGAISFDLTNLTLGDEFYITLKFQDQLDKGRKIQEDTLKWWLSQDLTVLSSAPVNQVPSGSALVDLAEFLRKCEPDIRERKVWGNGATFDISILESLYKTFNMQFPWNYQAAMDLRTFKRFIGKGASIPKIPGKHNALIDAKIQAEYVIDHITRRLIA